MENGEGQNEGEHDIRGNAEKEWRLRKSGKTTQSMLRQDVQELLYELEVHQIELEMQNEELRRSQNEVEAARKKYTDLYDFAPVGYVTLDRLGTILQINLSGAQMLGHVRSELVNRRFGVFVPAESRTALYAWLEQIFEADAKGTCELVLGKKKDKPLWAYLEAVLSETHEDCRVAIVDITERKQAEIAKADMAKQLERSNRDLEQFAFVASHDLQEPLRKIKMFGSLLLDRLGTDIPEEAKDYLERMKNAVDRMQTMIDGLLDLSRVNRNRGTFTSLHLTSVVQDALSDLETRVQAVNGQVIFDDLPVIEADEQQIRRLFQNLIGNALKFHKSGVPPVIHITGEYKDPSTITVRIMDNGIGFDQQYAERIFQPYQRLNGRSEFEGTGLGLAICKKIVGWHYGTIEAQSEPGVGTVFSITLPVLQSER